MCCFPLKACANLHHLFFSASVSGKIHAFFFRQVPLQLDFKRLQLQIQCFQCPFLPDLSVESRYVVLLMFSCCPYPRQPGSR